jgi:hypothetical protein
MGRALAPAEEMLVDEPGIGPAIERRQMGMDDIVTTDAADLEFAHVAEQGEVDGRGDLKNAGIAYDGSHNGRNGSGHIRVSLAFVEIERRAEA